MSSAMYEGTMRERGKEEQLGNEVVIRRVYSHELIHFIMCEVR